MMGNDYFITGIDSPVKILSFTIALPVNKTKSQGSTIPSGTLTISPGTRSDDRHSSSLSLARNS